MSRRNLGALMLVVLLVLGAFSGWAWWKRWSAPLIPVVLRPSFSVQGIDTGTPVRVNGVVVGQVASIGLALDAQRQLRPEVNLRLDLETMADRGLAEKLKAKDLTGQIQEGLRARLVAVSPSSGLLQVELLWDKNASAPTAMGPHEVPVLSGGLQSVLERAVSGLSKINQRNLTEVAQGLEHDLDYYYPRSDPEHARLLNAAWVAKTNQLVLLTSSENMGAKAARMYAACQSLRESATKADQKLDGATLLALEGKLRDAQEAMESFHEALQHVGPSLQSASGDVSGALKAVSDFAHLLKQKANGLTTEPLPPPR
jgi:hypothetical protein